jgi:large subunit ribosomal protein L9
MKLILLSDVEGVGKMGELQDVNDGFGRNYLVPRGLAVLATKVNVKKQDEHIKVLIRAREKSVKAAGDLRERIEAATLTLKHKTGADGKLFGSVTPKEIAEAIRGQLKLEIDRKAIKLKEPLKMTGSYTVDIHLGTGVNAHLKVEIEQE